MISLLDSDFRCGDQRLVHILSGREIEAVKYAKALRRDGMCDGIFVQGKDVCDWSFLNDSSGFNEYVFTDVSDTFKKVDYRFMRGARAISIGGIVCDIDFSAFSNLRRLGYVWSKKATGLDQLSVLSDIQLWGIGKSRNALPLNLRNSVRSLGFVRYGHEVIDLGEGVMNLRLLSIFMARSLVSIPEISSLRSLKIECVGSDNFDYESIPGDIEFLSITSCAPIRSFDFVRRMKNLKSLVIDKTSCVVPNDEQLGVLLSLPVLDVPHVRVRSGNLRYEWDALLGNGGTHF